MGMSVGKDRGGPKSEPNVVPMIDVLLVLLIFFMSIASTAVQRYDPTIDLPQAPEAEEKPNSQGELVFNVRWDAAARVAVISLDEQQVAEAQLAALVEEHARKRRLERLLVRSDREVPVRHVALLVEAAGRAGLADVAFAVLER